MQGQSETLVESAWERNMQLLGSSSYEAKREGLEASETVAGRSALRKYISAAAEGISKMQTEMINKDRIPRTLKGSVMLVPAETLALLTLRALIDRTYGLDDPETGASYAVVAKAIGKAVENELNFRNWIAASRESASEYAKANGLSKPPTSLAEKLLKDEGVSRASMFRWKRSFEDLNKYKWDQLEHMYSGDALLAAVVEALPECFEIHSPWRKGHPRKSVRMLPEFSAYFDQVETGVSRSQATKKPMLTRPVPWRAK